jgi:hypothetical protein
MAQAGIGAALAGSGATGARLVAGGGVCSGGASAVSVGITVPVTERLHAAFSAATSGGIGGVNVGVGWDL